jgi:membrane-bound lytic murein transglycosylase MltF
MLSKLTRIDAIPSLAGRYVGHKNPMDALQLTSKTGSDLVHDSWSDMRVSQFDTNSYVVTIFHETGSLAGATEFIRNVKQFVTTMMKEMETAALAESQH